MLCTITTSKRPALFKATIESCALKARDWHWMVDELHIFDDNSPEEQLNEMSDWLIGYHTRAFVHPSEELLGHPVNMQRIFDFVTERNERWLLHGEDDFILTRPGCPIMAALDVLLNNPKLIQCCFGAVDRQHQQRFFTPTGTAYTIRPWAISRDMYPPFTLNPSVIRVSALKNVGNFENVEGFELQYGLRCNLKGWRTADLAIPFLKHLGDGNSAYDINQTKR